MRPWQRAAVGALCACSGCIDTDPAVFVEAVIEQPSATLESSPLVAGLAGSFMLRLHLGSRASGDSQVSVQQFSVLAADASSEIHSPLAATLDPPSPITVPRGGDDPIVAVGFVADDNLLDLDEITLLCAPEGVVIRGALRDSLQEATVAVSSAPFAVACP